MVTVFFGSKRLIGIDIGSRFIKFAEIDYSSKGSKLIHFLVVPTPEGSFVGADLQNPELIASVINGTLSGEKIKNKNVAFGLYGNSVMVKKITMPRIDKKLLSQQIRWEAEQYIPFDLNQINLSHHVNENTSQTDMINVLIIAAQISSVALISSVAKAAALNLQVLDLSAFALANSFEHAMGTQSGLNHMLVHVGAYTTHVVIMTSGDVEFVRDISLGSHTCTLEIHKEMGLSVEEAETLKLAASRGEEVPEEIFKFINQFNQSLAEEVKNSLEYFIASQSDGSRISQIHLSGGGAKMSGLVDRVGGVVDCPVSYFNPFTGFKFISPNIQSSSEDIAYFSPIALGLALRKKGEV